MMGQSSNTPKHPLTGGVTNFKIIIIITNINFKIIISVNFNNNDNKVVIL